jgi:hypothetical protein
LCEPTADAAHNRVRAKAEARRWYVSTTATDHPVTAAPTQDDLVREGVDAAYAAEGYTKTVDGVEARDNAKLATATFQTVITAKARTNEERETKAIRKGELAKATFPSLPGPGEYDPSDVVARKVWEVARGAAWSEANPVHNSRVQKMVGTAGKGLVLCRTTVGLDSTDAVYVTDDPAMILADFSQPLKDAVQRAAERLALNLHMVGVRKPDMTKALKGEVDSGLKNATTLAKNKLALTTGDNQTEATEPTE